MAEFRIVARLDELPDLGGKEVIVDGTRICLIKHQGQVFATAAECPHKGAPLATGWVENGRVFCGLHGWEFDLRSGECLTNCNALLRIYPARIAGDSVEIAFTRDP